MIKLLHLSIGYGKERILVFKDLLAYNKKTSIDRIRNHLQKPVIADVFYYKNEIPMIKINLMTYDERCEVI